ncbi:conserved Plasmodium protein, unknown function [Plasmodium malariae]|uniref:Uncharacterized protein n=1 Tax=Plasmodium malariae TaxID=5858 RepID=A0A1D3SMC9_PLAMA|nr:conserved Plasmodium protein, unknown function [Plasmodium malariae]SCO92981.1 conserved Plasmodium protein, unknown function [Plasmodium malariae]
MMKYNSKKRSYCFHNLKVTEYPLSEDKKDLFHNFMLESEQYDYIKKRMKCSDLQDEGKYNKNIFCKLKDFYKNNDSNNFCNKSYLTNVCIKKKHDISKVIEEKVITEENKIKNNIYTGKFCPLLKCYITDEDLMSVNKNKLRDKEIESGMIHEKIYSKSENNSKTKYGVKRTYSEYTKRYSCDTKNCNEHTATKNLNNKNEYECLQEKTLQTKRKDSELEKTVIGNVNVTTARIHCHKFRNEGGIRLTEECNEMKRNENNIYSENREVKESVKKNKKNEQSVKKQNKRDEVHYKQEVYTINDNLKNKSKENELTHVFLENDLNCSPILLDNIYEGKSAEKNKEKLNEEIRKFRGKVNIQIRCNTTPGDEYMINNDVLYPYYSNSLMIEDERNDDKISILSKSLSNKNKLYEEMREKLISSNSTKINLNDKLKERIINKCSEYSSNEKLSFSPINKKVILYDKDMFSLNGDKNNSSCNSKCTIKYIDLINSNGSNIKNNIIEKKKKIKSIHNEILNLIKEDKEVNKGKNIDEENGDFSNGYLIYNRDGADKEVGKEAVNQMDGMHENYNEECKSRYIKQIHGCNNKIYGEGNDVNDPVVYNKNKLHYKIDDVEGKKKENNITTNNGYPFENFSSSVMLEPSKEDELFRKYIGQNRNNNKIGIMDNENDKKVETEVIGEKKEYIIKNKVPLRNNFLKNIKLIYEKENKILEINIKCFEKYSYFKIILNTYSTNNLINMNEHHVNFALSKVLFSNDIINRINKINFKKIMKALDFYGYLYDNIFLKNLCNKITINKWLSNKKFFHTIFTNCFLKIGIFYDLVYQYLYMDPIFINFLFSKNGGSFVKSFFLYNKIKAMKLMNKVIIDLKNISPSTDSVVNFLCGFFSHPKDQDLSEKDIIERQERSERIGKNITRKYVTKSGIEANRHLKNNCMNAMSSECSLNKTSIVLERKLKKNTCSKKKKKKNSYVYIKNEKYKKSLLRNILNKIWLNTDLYIKEKMYYDKNFTVKKKMNKSKVKNSKNVNNYLYDIHNSTSETSACSFLTDEEGLYYNFNKSDEINFKINERMNETYHQCVYNQQIDENNEYSAQDYYVNSHEENTEILINNTANNNGPRVKNIAKTFHSLECIPNISFDLYYQDCNYSQRSDSILSLCFKEEDICNNDKYINDISFLGIRISSKENKINYFNCFDVNLKVSIKKHLLSNINYNISKDDENISAFFPVWPYNPDYFGYKIAKNIKKEFNEIKRNILQEGEEEKKNSLEIIINKMNNNKMEKYDESTHFVLRENQTENNFFDFNKSRNNIHYNEKNITVKNDNADWNKNRNIDELKLKDCYFILSVKIYPIRTLALYTLYNSLYKDNNIKFVEFYSKSINNEIKEWLLLFLLPNFINKCIHKVTYPLKLTKNIFSESNEFYEDFFSNEYLKINDIEKIIIYTKNNSDEEIEICPFSFCYIWLKSTKYKIDRWISSKINEVLFTFPFANFLLSKYFSSFLLFIQLFHTCLDIDHMYLCKSHFYVSLKHNISFLHESLVNVLFSTAIQLTNV